MKQKTPLDRKRSLVSFGQGKARLKLWHRLFLPPVEISCLSYPLSKIVQTPPAAEPVCVCQHVEQCICLYLWRQNAPAKVKVFIVSNAEDANTETQAHYSRAAWTSVRLVGLDEL